MDPIHISYPTTSFQKTSTESELCIECLQPKVYEVYQLHIL